MERALEDLAFAEVAISSERVVGLPLQAEQHAGGLCADGRPPRSVVEHAVLAEHLALADYLQDRLLADPALDDLQLATVDNEHV